MAGLNDPIEQVVQTGKGPRRRTVPKWQALHPHSAIKSFVRLGYGLGLTIETIAAITGKTAQTIRAHYLELSRETEAQKAREAFRKLDL